VTSGNKERDWAPEIAKASAAMAQQMEPMVQADRALRRQMEPIIQAAEVIRRQMEPLIRADQTLRRQMGSIVRASKQFPPGGLARQIAHAVGADMRDLPMVHQRTAALTVELTTNATAVVTGSGSVALPAIRIDGHGTVENPQGGQAERSLGQILAVVLVIIAASGLLGVQGPDRAAVDHYLTVIGVALPIALLIWSKQDNRSRTRCLGGRAWRRGHCGQARM
jgi:hypothetical protein